MPSVVRNSGQAFRHAVRHAWRRPGFTAFVATILGLGIGANTAIYSLVEAALFPPFAVHDPARLVGVYTSGVNGAGYSSVSYPDYTYFRDHNTVYSDMMAYANIRLRWTKGDKTTFPWATIVTSNYFSVLGVHPVVGRVFSPELDDARTASAVAVVSNEFWKRQLASRPNLAGEVLILNDHPFVIIGVLPKNFEGVDLAWGGVPDIWVPMSMQPVALPNTARMNILESREARAFLVMGRLKEDVGLMQAGAETRLMARQLEQSYPVADKGRSAFVLPADEARMWPGWRESVVHVLLLLVTAVGFVLLLSCANVANLLLTRAVAREREIALQLALGSSRERIVSQLLLEGVVLAFIGAAMGLLFGGLLIRILPASQLSPQMHMNLALRLDYRVFLVTLLLSLLTAFIFALLPAFTASQVDLTEALKGGRNATSGRTRGGRIRRTIITFEVVFAFFSLVGAGLFVRSLLHLEREKTGFDPRNILAATMFLTPQRYSPALSSQFYAQLLNNVSRSQGIDAVCISEFRPLETLRRTRQILSLGHQGGASDTGLAVQSDDISPGCFRTLQVPMLRGRDFTQEDNSEAPPVAIISQTLARHLWPHEDPVGKELKLQGDDKPYQVIGVVADIKYHTVWEPPQPYMYLPLAQQYDPEVNLLIRTAGSPLDFLPKVREQIGILDQTVPLFDIEPLNEQVVDSLSQPRVITRILTLFGFLALLLATAGIYSVVAYSVKQRTHEIGIRMALGARKYDILRMVIAEGFRLTLIGVAIGVASALASARLLSSVLYGVQPTDLLTFGVVSLLLIAIAVLASYVASRRATNVDPTVALRYE